MFFEILKEYKKDSNKSAIIDEKVLKVYKKYNIAPIEINLDFIADILTKSFSSNKSIIITGSAGDGKSFILRKLYKELTDNETLKDNSEVEIYGEKIKFILDFTAVEDKKALLKKAENEKYIIAANEGVLSKYLENEDKFLIINLSKTSSYLKFKELLDKILEYIDKYEKETLNVKILKKIRPNLEKLIKIFDYNYSHLTMRRLFIFIAHIILDEGDLYSNIFADKQKKSLQNTPPFKFLRTLSIGQKSNDFIDEMILFSNDKQLQNDYINLEDFYRKRERYLEEGDFSLIEREVIFFRRHLFFMHNHYELMRYISFDDFELLFESLKEGKSPPKKIKKELALALNRIFLGELVNEKESIFIASSFKNSNLKISDEIVEQVLIKNIEFEFIKGNDEEYAEIYLKINNKKMLLDLDIFEFLIRVAKGSLVNSFSNEFLERVMIFKSSLIVENEDIKLFNVDEKGRIELIELELGDDCVKEQ